MDKSSAKRGLVNASYLTIGNLVSQVIGIFGFIYIARMLGPESYGIFITVTSFVGLFTLFTLKGLNKVIVREGCKDIENLPNILNQTIGIRNAFIIFSIILCIISTELTGYSNQVKFFIILYSLELAEFGISTYLSTIFQASERMKFLAIFDIVNRLLITSFSVLFLFMGYGLLELFLVHLCCYLFVIICKYYTSKTIAEFNFLSPLKYDDAVIRSAITFSLIGFLNIFVVRVDAVMISLMSTSTDVGLYGVAFKISREAILLRNIAIVSFLPILVKRFAEGPVKQYTMVKYTFGFFFLILFLTLCSLYFIDDFIRIFFGEEYASSAKILKIMSFYLCFWWAVFPYVTAAQATHNEKFILLPILIMAILNIGFNYVFFYEFGLIGFAYSKVLVHIVGSMVLCFLIHFKLREQGHLV